jgi:pimeloyl-ACP methyl ester carboxylesterase
MTPPAGAAELAPLPYLVRPASPELHGSDSSDVGSTARSEHTSPSSTVHPPLLVLLHGYGGDAHAMLPLAEALHPRFTVVVPQAPVPLPNGG